MSNLLTCLQLAYSVTNRLHFIKKTDQWRHISSFCESNYTGLYFKNDKFIWYTFGYRIVSSFKAIEPGTLVAFPGLRKQRMSFWVAQKGIYLLFGHTIWYPGNEQSWASTPCARVVETPLFHCSRVAALFDISWNCLYGWILSRKDYYRAWLNLFSAIKCNHIEKKSCKIVICLPEEHLEFLRTLWNASMRFR